MLSQCLNEPLHEKPFLFFPNFLKRWSFQKIALQYDLSSIIRKDGTYFVPFGVIENRVTEVNSKYFNGNCAEAWILYIYVSWITCILLSQVISLKKIVESSAKFTILISWSPICVPLILLLTLMKVASTSAAVMYKSIENRHPWQTSRVRVKGSDRKPFILILDWILVYTSLTMWMNLYPYPNLCKAEKLKSQWTLTILQKDFYSVYLTHQLCKKGVKGKVKNWC